MGWGCYQRGNDTGTIFLLLWPSHKVYRKVYSVEYGTVVVLAGHTLVLHRPASLIILDKSISVIPGSRQGCGDFPILMYYCVAVNNSVPLS